MKFRDEYTQFNDFYYNKLKAIYERASDDLQGNNKLFLDECEKQGIDLNSALYKRLIDDYEEVVIDSHKYLLLPMGFINSNIPSSFVDITYNGNNNHYGLNYWRNIFLRDPKFTMFYYPNSLRKYSIANLNQVRDSYIDHYAKTLDEHWSIDDFYRRLDQLEYVAIKYAMDMETKEIFAVGFFGALVKSGAGGASLTDAELYLMPQFRKLGIASRMVGLSFELARMEGIENFDSVTYRVKNQDSLAFWNSVGANVSGLIHIEGNIDEMLQVLSNKQDLVK